MNRRNFLRSMLGVAAATALPSEVFPFRKIFLPSTPLLVPAVNPLNLAAIEAIQIDMLRRELPDLLFQSSSLYERIKKGSMAPIGSRFFHIPMQIKENNRV